MIRELESFVTGHPLSAAVYLAAALAVLLLAWQLARRAVTGARGVLRGHQAEDLLTIAAAGLAQAVVMNGMWGFAGHVLHFTGAERGSLFAFLEIAVVACAFRARRNMGQFHSAGPEGIAVWVLSAMSGFFAAMAATSLPAALFRLAAPLVAAWLWHRAMSLDHRRRFADRSVHWRLTTERILVKLHLAEPAERTASEVDAHRRLARLARAAKQVRVLRVAGARPSRLRWALRRLESALEAAVEHAALATDPARQDQMLAQLGALNAAESLAALQSRAPWDPEPGMVTTSPVAILDNLARTITRRIPEPERWPDDPAPRADVWPTAGLPAAELFEVDEPEPAAPEVVHPEQDADRPLQAPVDEAEGDGPGVARVDDLDAEAAELFGPPPASTVPEPPRPPARPSPPARVRPPAAEWTPESVGRTEDEVIALVRTLSRNKLAETLPCSRGTADKLRARYLEPALNGAGG
jgi:hypothetical protein